MSIARHHAEWLSLVEASGPFLSLQVLLEAFPQGLEAHDPEKFRTLKQAHEEWQDSGSEVAIHRAWVEWVLREVLGFPDEVLLSGQQIPTSLRVTIAEHQEILRPDWAIAHPDTRQPRLLVQVVPPQQGLEKQLAGSRWVASPAVRMMELLRGTGVWLGLVTNGDRWMLVNAPRGGVELLPGVKYENPSPTVSYISWYANLWVEEKVTLRAFCTLLGVERFFRVDDRQTLEALLVKSADSQQEVTNQLGDQVRKAVEVLVQKLDKIDQDRNRSLLKEISEAQLYEAALFVMMRLVFLFSAEEKGLLLLGDRLYDQYYAVSTLRSELREMADKNGEEVLERRCDAWGRLLATFRMVYGGAEHDALRSPPYGGDLFNPDKFPFLEGRLGGSWREVSAQPIPVDNRTVLHLLEALQILQVKVPGGGTEPRRLSFRALDVEQIGHVYEGLLDRTAVRAKTPVLGLAGIKDKEPTLEELEAQWANGEAALVEYLQKLTERSPSALRNALNPSQPGSRRSKFAENQSIQTSLSLQAGNLNSPRSDSQEEARFAIACNNDRQLWERVKPFAGLIRLDTFGYPAIVPAGSVYVTKGSDRRETGTHYTPKSLTEEIVRYTLEPLVYEGVAEGKSKPDWQLKSASELLKLKVCDMAMGSGAFLVQVCRYLGERLVEAWEAAERANRGKIVVTPEGKLSKPDVEENLIPQDADERLIVAKRIVAERCIYGVDKNPLAVEMAKLSLWLETLQKDKPFTFLDHALKCGDSLVGVTQEQLRCWNLDVAADVQQFDIGSDAIQQEVDEAIALRLQIESKPANTPQDQAEKAYLLARANAKIKDLKDRCDLLVSSYLAEGSNKEREALRQRLLLVAKSEKDVSASDRAVLPDLNLLRPFHWELEFPEVFLTVRSQGGSEKFRLQKSSKGQTANERDGKAGFDAIVGNPPFMGGSKITGALGTPYRDYLVDWLAKGKRGSADLCAYFFLHAQQLLCQNGGFGLVATNTIAQGDTREVGLDQLVAAGGIIPRAVPSRKWPGTANLEVAYVWLRQSEWKGEFILDENPVSEITPFLTVPGKALGNPYRLIVNQGKSFLGSKVYGQGFVLQPNEAQDLIKKDLRNQDVLFPYLNGEDLNSRPDQSPSRWVINFFGWPLDAERDDPKKPKGRPYAIDYPDCLAIVEEKVKPEREKNNRKLRRERWWQYGEIAPGLYEAIAGCDRVLVTAAVSPTTAFNFATTGIIFAHKLIIFVIDKWSYFSILQSTLHREWAYNYSSTLGGTTLNYSPSDCFETFPFPSSTANLDQIGEKYYSHRQQIMLSRQEGLTKTYNRFHNPDETAADIQKLRDLHVEMDSAVAAAYGWTDLDLNHGFHETKQGLRYTISEAARREVLDRLLQLNHQRYAEEVAAGLHEKGKKKGKTSTQKKLNSSKKSPGQMNLILD